MKVVNVFLQFYSKPLIKPQGEWCWMDFLSCFPTFKRLSFLLLHLLLLSLSNTILLF